jgi:hypothetical protein
MHRRTIRALVTAVAGLLGASLVSAWAAPVPLHETFEETTVAALAARGWHLPAGAALEPSERPADGHCLYLDRSAQRGFAERLIPVQPGRIYRASALLKCRGALGGRGAALFLQFADAAGKHVNGGMFPPGLLGDHDWTEIQVPHTVCIPADVAFLRVTLGLDGTGEAWFDDVLLEEVVDWSGPALLEPTDGAAVTTALPGLRWQSWEAELGRMKRGYCLDVQFSRDAAFPAGSTETVILPPSATEARPAVALAVGTWFWRVNVRPLPGELPPSRAQSFVVPAGIPIWPPRVTPDWAWTAEPRPWLEAVYRPESATVTSIEATVNGVPATDVTQAEGRVRFRPASDLLPGVHEVTLVLRSPAGEAVTLADVFCNTPSAERMSFRPDGLLLIEGVPHFPLGAYRDPSDREDTFDGLLEAGFTVTHSYGFEGAKNARPAAERRAYLEAAAAHGLRVFMGLPRQWVRDADTAACRRYVAETLAAPGLLCWYQFDEPEIQGVSPEALAAVYRGLTATDPFHPKITLVCSIGFPVRDSFRAYAAACDVFWEDPYPVPSKPLLMVEEKVLACREAAGPGKPVWCVLQGFDWAAWKAANGLETKGKRTSESVAAMTAAGAIPVTRPSPAETRCMAHLAIAAGAKGLIWYWSPNWAVHVQEDSPEVWRGICATVGELRALMPWLVAETGPGDDLPVPAPLRVWSRVVAGQRVVVLVNPEERDLRVDGAALPETVHRATPGAGDTARQEAGAWIFAPYQVVVLRGED